MDDGKPQVPGGIRIKHHVGLKRGKPAELSIECGQLIVRLEEISLLHKQVIVSIEALDQPGGDLEFMVKSVGAAIRATTELMHKRICRASPN